VAEGPVAEPVGVSAVPVPAAMELVGANSSAAPGATPAGAGIETLVHSPAGGAAEEAPAEYELVLDADQAELLETPLPAPESSPAASELQVLNSDQFLTDLLSELDALAAKHTSAPPHAPASEAPQPAASKLPPPASTSDADAPPEEFPAPPPAAHAHAIAQTSPNSNDEALGPLREVFDEFRAELGEMGFEDEDLETHYNLGIAYREMGLLDEAIGEFQKVAQAIDRGRPFRYAMQCCTLLGLSFVDKGQPQIAAMWYERALATPGLDPESILALRYDLGAAQELAGDESAARKSYMQVYAMNIDYRDVAERIATLGKRA